MTRDNDARPGWGEPRAEAGGELLVREAPGLVEVAFHRPEKLNAFTDAMYDGLLELCARVAVDPAVRAVVVRGSGGRAFAAGNDIASFRGFTTGADGVAYEARIRRVLDALADLPQLTVAAVDGVCVGGGLAVATSCDLRVATPASRFGYPIARTLGNALSAPIVLRCAEVFGDPVTREMLLASRLVDAPRALAVGALVSVVEPQHLDAEVWSLVEGVRRAAPRTLAVTKEQLRAGRSGYDVVVDDERLAGAYGSADFREGVRAFLAKERPSFTGQ
ncbi:enoyl-CoA hydratase [Lapillicoccus jejuensis]|uniref:Enoyl-CoA hydratase/carnithine racemase n=1 Tax=Lapillicoccus jejuensis TaxID=402171 RepID=A0A542E711_9MICO|nr:enoyl-CoA hydratase [Lapillicoccus jejuensis]TQJ11079.1 enoyl-CoA hydratase/carnithine racemase [Lapillicoccus jejuensis]